MDTVEEMEKERCRWRDAFWIALLFVCPLVAFGASLVALDIGQSMGRSKYAVTYTREVGRMIYLINVLEKNGQTEEAAAKLAYLNSHWYCVGNENRFDQFRDNFYSVKTMEDAKDEDPASSPQ